MPYKNRIKLGFAGTPMVAFNHFSHIKRNNDFSIDFVLTQAEKKIGRGQNKSSESHFQSVKNLNLFKPEDLNNINFKKSIESFDIDLLIVVAYGKIIPDWLLAHPKYGCMNVHFSNLPKWRGAAPIQRSIISGENETGVSFMKLVSEMDAGPVYRNISHKYKNLTKAKLENELTDLSLKHIDGVIKDIVFRNPKPLAQNEAEATFAPKISKNEGLIDWHLSGEKIYSMFLAFSDWPQLYFEFRGQVVKVMDLELTSTKNGPAGTVSEFNNKEFSVNCKDCSLKIIKLQLPGKNEIDAKDFFNAKRDIISVGDILV